MGFPPLFFRSFFFFFFFFFSLISISSSFCLIHDGIEFKGIDVERNPFVSLTPKRISGYVSSAEGSKESLSCERIRVCGTSRFKLVSYASVYRVTLAPSVAILEKFQNKMQICFHNNASLGLCACENDDWKNVHKGIWFSLMSPFEDKYLDVKLLGEFSGSLKVTVDEELQRWRFFCLALGFVLLLLAPIVSSWAPFYYSSSMAIGILLVVIILLFQGMKLLPTGRKNVFYLTIYGSVLGAGSFLVHHLSMFINSLLAAFGVSEEMHNPVSVFVMVFIVLAGAALGYWLVRKYVISEDGGVDVGVAQFVKWAMRIIALTLIFQSTVDTPLAVVAVSCCVAVCYLITYLKLGVQEDATNKYRKCKWAFPMWLSHNFVLFLLIWMLFGLISFLKYRYESHYGHTKLWARNTGGKTAAKKSRAEFLSRSSPKVGRQGSLWNGYVPRSSPAYSVSPLKGFSSPSSTSTENQEVYYSTFHKTANRKKFSKKEWAEFTDESTRQALAEWSSSPEFTDWVINNADRINVLDDASDESIGSSSDSTYDNILDSTSHGGLGLFKWQL